jgi:uncharacterized protein (TIGR02757 family)
MQDELLFELLEKKYKQYNKVDFIAQDPICIPHRFSKKQDIEIAGFFAAILAWGLRKTIINSTNRLLTLMDESPHEFILNFQEQDLRPFVGFVHRTFNTTDLLYFMNFLQFHYKQYDSLENAFTIQNIEQDTTIENSLRNFYTYFFSLEHPERTHKHIASPAKNSACKRINMYLRWMVRKDKHGVDFGIWKTIKPHQLICPLDVHVSHIAHKLNMITHQKSNWKIALALTDELRKFDASDPAKYDFALFGLGVVEKGRF